jgi:hypothetical protein
LKELFKLSDSMDPRLVIVYYMVPLFFMMTALSFLGVEFINVLYFFFSYFWVITFLSPYSNDKITAGKYRFSTLRFLFVFNEAVQNTSLKVLERANNIKLKWLIRGMPPIFLVIIIWALLYSGQFYFAILGYGYFELIHYIFIKKLNWNPFRDV